MSGIRIPVKIDSSEELVASAMIPSHLVLLLVLILTVPGSNGSMEELSAKLGAAHQSPTGSVLTHFNDIARSLNPVTDKVAPHNYGPFYEQHLLPFRQSARRVKILEIGLGCGMFYGPGASVPLWLHPQLFPTAEVELHMLEFDRRCGENWQRTHRQFDVMLHFGDQANPADLQRMLAKSGPFDIIIDDGGHTMDQQLSSLTHLFSSGLKHGGAYFLEDYGTSHDPGYNPNRIETTLQRTVQWITGLLSAEHLDKKPLNPELPHLMSIACGPEICAFFKNPHPNP